MAYSRQKRSSPELLQEVGLDNLSNNKRRRGSFSKTDNECTTDTVSCSSFESDSEYQNPHPRPTSQCFQLHNKCRPSPRPKPVYGNTKFETDIGLKPKRNSKSRNAIMAKQNRLKKKIYYEELEAKNAQLEAEMKVLQNKLKVKAKEVESLKMKASNLEHVIRNSTEIGSLLKCVHQHTGLNVTSSLLRSEPSQMDRNTDVNLHSQGPSTSDKHSPTEEEGNIDILSLNSQEIASPFEFCDNNDDGGINFDLPNPVLSDLDCWFSPGSFEIPSSTESASYDSNMCSSGCGTPSKEFAAMKKENLISDVGVCLHVDKKRISLEVCESCNTKASQ